MDGPNLEPMRWPQKAPTPKFGGRASSARTASPQPPSRSRTSTPRAASPRKDMDRIRGLMAAAVDAPLRAQAQSTEGLFTSFCTRPPSPARRAREAQATSARQRAMRAEEHSEDRAVRHAKAQFAAKMQRERLAKQRAAAVQRASAAAAARASRDADDEERQRREGEAQACAAHERAEMRRMFEAQERHAAAAAAAARRMRERWRVPPRRPRPPPRRKPADPYAEWRGTVDDGTDEDDEPTESEDEDDGEEAEQAETEEARQQAASRRAKVRERDEAAQRILAHSSRTLTDALGLRADASDADVARGVRSVLRLLHPDFPINLRLVEGTRRQRRIEAAFKRLNGLRDEAER